LSGKPISPLKAPGQIRTKKLRLCIRYKELPLFSYGLRRRHELFREIRSMAMQSQYEASWFWLQRSSGLREVRLCPDRCILLVCKMIQESLVYFVPADAWLQEPNDVSVQQPSRATSHPMRRRVESTGFEGSANSRLKADLARKAERLFVGATTP
jgi:hypothetical protein